ncbi:TIGR01777 family protein [Chthonomonas calidirosea]|uniref:TIGR01777 family oxidoreductase n=1 Tax=Chthonomonas calidirosea TaxID=454171 RepID=UPI0006DD495A|nr:TIGR01777 family oxidoreductase [Chthonomonas calidirosea]CEK13317.1 TIGR01777 family protein [Chthonomonas calidirosea]
MRILVTGATGFLGKALCTQLQKQGHTLSIVTRYPERVHSVFGANVESICWNHQSSLLKALEEAQAVINLAGASIAGKRWNAAYKEELVRSRVETTHTLVDGMHHCKQPPSILLSASAVGYYGDCNDKMITEERPAGSDFLAELCLQWEAEANRARQCGARVATMRLATVLGPGGALAKMLRPFPSLPINPWKLGLGGPFGSGKQWMPWIHIEDAVGLFLWALQEASLDGPCNAVAPETISNLEFARALASLYGKQASFPIPAFLLRLLLGEFAESLLASQRVVPAVAKRLGYTYRYPELLPALKESVTVLERAFKQ